MELKYRNGAVEISIQGKLAIDKSEDFESHFNQSTIGIQLSRLEKLFTFKA